MTREAEADSRYASNGGGGAALARQVVEAYEPVAGPDAVQTPKQVTRWAGGQLELECDYPRQMWVCGRPVSSASA